MLINGLATHGGKSGLPRRRCDENDTPCSTYKGVASEASGGFDFRKSEKPLISGAKRMSEFFAMGGYAFYIWGSYGVAAALLALEVVFLLKRKREAKA
jgi:heme exporter protein CcmD